LRLALLPLRFALLPLRRGFGRVDRTGIWVGPTPAEDEKTVLGDGASRTERDEDGNAKGETRIRKHPRALAVQNVHFRRPPNEWADGPQRPAGLGETGVRRRLILEDKVGLEFGGIKLAPGPGQRAISYFPPNRMDRRLSRIGMPSGRSVQRVPDRRTDASMGACCCSIITERRQNPGIGNECLPRVLVVAFELADVLQYHPQLHANPAIRLASISIAWM
jgi:hypothetical protein